jgi:hypothetical protein
LGNLVEEELDFLHSSHTYFFFTYYFTFFFEKI